MKVLGIQTNDFAAYHDLVHHLRSHNVEFLSLLHGEEVPSRVGVVITTAAEVDAVGFPQVVVYSTPEETLEAAVRALSGLHHYRRCVVGVDPGERPGVAVIGDGRILRLAQAGAPEDVRDAIEHAMASVPAETFVVRVGHGAPTFRDRILRRLRDLAVDIEIVDETRSTPTNPRSGGQRDTAAATRIGLTRGVPLMRRRLPPPRPTDGELRDIQRKSRLVSDGRVTISRALARTVALGHLTLDQAVERQRGGAYEA